MTENLSSQLEKYLPQPISRLVKYAGEKAGELGQELYIIGGVVRDLFLGRANFDLDLVVEGDAIKLAQELARDSQTKLITHTRFGTAKLKYTDFSLDLATARCETYSKPGALPTVKPGTITDDLCRRDFSINAMAICLSPRRFGELIDLYYGRDDLHNRLIRILHPNSFIDDATRILRALRYEQRLDFKLEQETEELLQRHIDMLDTISGDRIRHELELILKEDYPERVLMRAEELGVLGRLNLSLKGDVNVSKRFDIARQISKRTSTILLYLCLLVYNLTEGESEQFISGLNFPKKSAQAIRHTLQLKVQIHNLVNPGLAHSEIYRLLQIYVPQAIQANMLASESSVAGQNLQLYLDKLRYIKPLLNGEDLKKMGIPSGPELGNILDKLYEAKLNGEVRTKADEEKLVCILRYTL